MIPCEKDKCLKYPVCKSKGIIVCRDLEDYYYYLKKQYQDFQAWQSIHQTLPNLHSIMKLHADNMYYPDINSPYILRRGHKKEI